PLAIFQNHCTPTILTVSSATALARGYGKRRSEMKSPTISTRQRPKKYLVLTEYTLCLAASLSSSFEVEDITKITTATTIMAPANVRTPARFCKVIRMVIELITIILKAICFRCYYGKRSIYGSL